VILACAVLIGQRGVTDERTDGRFDDSYVACTYLCRWQMARKASPSRHECVKSLIATPGYPDIMRRAQTSRASRADNVLSCSLANTSDIYTTNTPSVTCHMWSPQRVASAKAKNGVKWEAKRSLVLRSVVSEIFVSLANTLDNFSLPHLHTRTYTPCRTSAKRRRPYLRVTAD